MEKNEILEKINKLNDKIKNIYCLTFFFDKEIINEINKDINNYMYEYFINNYLNEYIKYKYNNDFYEFICKTENVKINISLLENYFSFDILEMFEDNIIDDIINYNELIDNNYKYKNEDYKIKKQNDLNKIKDKYKNLKNIYYNLYNKYLNDEKNLCENLYFDLIKELIKLNIIIIDFNITYYDDFYKEIEKYLDDKFIEFNKTINKLNFKDYLKKNFK